MLYEKHIPELKSGQSIKIKRTVNNDATKKFILSMFKRRAYYRLKDYKNVVIKTNNELWHATAKGKILIQIWTYGQDIFYQEENLVAFL